MGICVMTPRLAVVGILLCASALVCHAEDLESLIPREVEEMMPREVGERAHEASAGVPKVLAYANKLDRAMKHMEQSRTNWPVNLEKIRNGVVQLKVVQEKFLWTMPYRAPLRETVFGSGWFIDNKEFGVSTGSDILVLTNAHVAKQASSITVMVPELGQEPILAKAVGICVQRDVALLKIQDPAKMLEMYRKRTGQKDGPMRMRLGDSDKMLRGAPIMAVGYPLGMQSVKASMGIVSGYQQFKNSLYLSITAPINPGNSGGPLYNKAGQVVGINSAKFAKASGISFAIPSNQVKVMLDALYKTREFIEPELGLQISMGTPNLNEYIVGIKSNGGVYVKDVVPGALYAQAGGKKGDLLLSVDGHKVDRMGKIWMPKLKERFSMQGLLLRHQVGGRLAFEVFRRTKGQPKGALVKLVALYKGTTRQPVHHLYEPIIERPRFVSVAGFIFMELNLVAANLNGNIEELVQYMLPKNRSRRAVIVTNIVPGSLAADDGAAKKGLLVQRVNGQQVDTMEQLCAALGAKLNPESFWTIATAKTFTAFRVADVRAYEKRVGGDKQHTSVFSGCGAKSIAEMLS